MSRPVRQGPHFRIIPVLASPFCARTKVTALTVSAIEILLDTVSKPHSLVKDVLPTVDTGIVGFLESFWGKALVRTAEKWRLLCGVGWELPPGGMAARSGGMSPPLLQASAS